MSDPLERLIDALRQPGTAEEMVGEPRALDALASAVTSQKGPPVKSTSGRRLRVASFIAAGVIGFGGAAAAGPGSFGDDSLDDTVTQLADGTTETTAPDTTEPPAPDTTEPPTPDTTEPPAPDTTEPPVVVSDADTTADAPVDDPDTLFDERECAPGNHGKTVSSVARTADRTSDDVRDAAHSSCGKKSHDDGQDADEPDVVADDAADDAAVADGDDSDPADDGKGNGNGKGNGKNKDAKSNGQGKGNGNGKGNGKNKGD